MKSDSISGCSHGRGHGHSVDDDCEGKPKRDTLKKEKRKKEKRKRKEIKETKSLYHLGLSFLHQVD